MTQHIRVKIIVEIDKHCLRYEEGNYIAKGPFGKPDPDAPLYGSADVADLVTLTARRAAEDVGRLCPTPATAQAGS